MKALNYEISSYRMKELSRIYSCVNVSYVVGHELARSIFISVLWHVDPLLGNDREISSYTRAVTE
jgi:hypothetical protein